MTIPRLLLLLLVLTFSLRASGAQAIPAVPTYSPLEWHLSTVHAAYAWARGADGHGQTIEVIDTGLDRHMALTILAGRIAPSFAANPLHEEVPVPCPPAPGPAYMFTPHCVKAVLVPDPSPYLDFIGHGSFIDCEIACTGTAYAYYGIAPRARLAIARVFETSGADVRDVTAAIRWGIANHIHIMSLSLVSPMPDAQEAATIAAAIRAGVVVVAAAGNTGTEGDMFPGSYPGVVRVAATDRWNRHADFSTRGPDVTIAAPGYYLFGIAPNTPNRENAAGLVTWNGTSMATPLVAGAIADLASAGYSYAEAVRALTHGATSWRHMNRLQYGAGVLNLEGALQYLVRPAH